MEQLLEQMKLGFNKADLDKLAQAFESAYYSLTWYARGAGDQREFYNAGSKTLKALKKQETQFEYFVGLPERA